MGEKTTTDCDLFFPPSEQDPICKKLELYVRIIYNIFQRCQCMDFKATLQWTILKYLECHCSETGYDGNFRDINPYCKEHSYQMFLRVGFVCWASGRIITH